MNIVEQAKAAKIAALRLATADSKKRNQALVLIADRLKKNQAKIIKANSADLQAAEADGLSESLLKRLSLSSRTLSQLRNGLMSLADMPDPLGQVTLRRELSPGLILNRVTVPLGLIGVIFESRPEALVQIAGLCLKSGNAVILKGGKEARLSNRILFGIIRQAAREITDDFTNALMLVETHEDVADLLALNDYIDLLIPRGSNNMIRHIMKNTKIPVLGHADGICHIYLDAESDRAQALEIIYDSKCQYPAACNAAETLLVHREALSFLPEIKKKLKNTRLLGDKECRRVLTDIEAAQDVDWRTEYTDNVLSVKIVNSIEEAINHINFYGSRHTETIITNNQANAHAFLNKVDASTVLHNASTRFSDGFRFGFGAEVGISTGKIHARGPVGIDGLTTYKYLITGNGHRVEPFAQGAEKFTHLDLPLQEKL